MFGFVIFIVIVVVGIMISYNTSDVVKETKINNEIAFTKDLQYLIEKNIREIDSEHSSNEMVKLFLVGNYNKSMSLVDTYSKQYFLSRSKTTAIIESVYSTYLKIY